jgi:hypothetical protein
MGDSVRAYGDEGCGGASEGVRVRSENAGVILAKYIQWLNAPDVKIPTGPDAYAPSPRRTPSARPGAAGGGGWKGQAKEERARRRGKQNKTLIHARNFSRAVYFKAGSKAKIPPSPESTYAYPPRLISFNPLSLPSPPHTLSLYLSLSFLSCTLALPHPRSILYSRLPTLHPPSAPCSFAHSLTLYLYLYLSISLSLSFCPQLPG